MKDRPILFSAPMVRAILNGTKTQTRRVVKPTPEWVGQSGVLSFNGRVGLPHAICPYGQPGDRLWVRESFSDDCDPHWVMYRADHRAERRAGGELFDACSADELATVITWRPSIHMPRWASRITLEVTGLRVERLQDISEADAMAEGCPLTDTQPFVKGYGSASASGWYSDLWESINGPGAWEANPWVWVVEFRRVEGGAV